MSPQPQRTFVTTTGLLYAGLIGLSVVFAGVLIALPDYPFIPTALVIGIAWALATLVWPIAGLIGYSVILLIRPQEFVAALDLPIPIEKIIVAPALIGLAFKIIMQHRRTGQGIRFNTVDRSVALFVLVALMSVVTSYWFTGALNQWVYVFRLFVIYILIAKVIESEKQFRLYVVFVILTTVFHAAASTINYYRGIREYEMGIERAVGLDSSFGDPNSLAATIVYTLPLAYYYFRGSHSRVVRGFMAGFMALLVWCVILTGSRTGMSGVLFLGLLVILEGKNRARKLLLGFAAALVLLVAMPDQYLDRFASTVDTSSDTGAAMSARSRIDGFLNGAKLMLEHPLLGVGVGQYLMVIGSEKGIWLEAHNLAGQLMGDLGMLGVIVFIAWLYTLFKNLGRLKRHYAERGPAGFLMYNMAVALQMHLFALLWMGLGGHNLYRYNWYVVSALVAAMISLTQRQPVAPEYASLPATDKQSLSQAEV
jgi:O-antigen ligase